MNEKFRKECKLLNDRLGILNEMLEKLKQRLILQDLSKELNTQMKEGFQLIKGLNWLEEVYVDGETLTLINKSKDKNRSYVIYTKREYHTIGLGFDYKKEIIAPHQDFEVEKILTKYNDVELNEILELVDTAIININKDIDYLNFNHDGYEHYYGEYNKGFESRNHYESISEVINDYKSL